MNNLKLLLFEVFGKENDINNTISTVIYKYQIRKRKK